MSTDARLVGGSEQELVYRRSPGVIAAEIHGEMVLMKPGSDAYLFMNPTASAIWRAIEAPASLGEISAQLCQGFDIERESCTDQTAAFLVELVDSQLVVESGPQPA